ncbi:MAG: tetratricopeptide repeat protein [Acidobacteriota bacterium]
MKRLLTWALLESAIILPWTMAVERPAALTQPAAIIIDYPSDGSLYPPEFPPPTFLWRDRSEEATVWSIDIAFGDSSRRIQVRPSAELMRVGEIDPRCVTPTNAPVLTPEQKVMRVWTPDVQTWTSIKKHSVKRAAVITITGFKDRTWTQAISRGQVRIQVSRDPVGAPIFYRDVPLMPTEGEQGVIRPLPPAAIGLIKWRLRDVAQTESRTLMENLPTCANCHSFSLDGKTLGLDVDGPQNDKGLYALTSIAKETVIRNQDVIKWSSFGARLGGKLRAAFMSQVSPDGRYVINTIEDPTPNSRRDLFDKYYSANFNDHRFLQVFYPTRGILAWYSRETGQLQPLPGASDPRYVQTDGVWSPDGKYIVFARAEAKVPYPEGWQLARYANDPNETQIQYDLYRVPFNDGNGGAPEPIVGASRNGMSNNFPKVSPDGRWIVYVQCRNGQLMRPDSQLYIVPFEGGESRRMNCNTPLMNSWHSFSPNGRWMVFSSKSRSPFTQMYLTHLDEAGNDTPPILIENATAANRAVNIPEFVNVAPENWLKIETPAMDFFRVFERALDLASKNQVGAAIREWQKAAELNPEEARVHFNLALALEKQGQIEGAIAEYQKAVDLDPENSGACTNLAVALARRGQMDEAIEYFAKAVALQPSSAKAHGNLGAALMEKGRLDEAIEHCRTALQIDPEYADAHNSLGIILTRIRDVDGAIVHLEKAVAVNPRSFEYRYNLGSALAAKGRFEEAIPHFEQAAGLSNREEPLSLDMLSAVYAKAGRIGDALTTARRALEIATRTGQSELAAGLSARITAYEKTIAGGNKQ